MFHTAIKKRFIYLRMKRFNEAFRTKLYNTIQDIEDSSLVEIVVIIRPQSGSYRDIPLWGGVWFSFLLYSFFMFSPFDFDVFLIYVFTILSFLGIYTLLSALPEIAAKFIPRSRKEKMVEIYARAAFQKGGIRFTSQRIGTLVYISLLEKKTFILPDRGAETAIPAEDWERMKQDFQMIYNESDVPGALIKTLASYKSLFSASIPPVENDINELPDDLKIEL